MVCIADALGWNIGEFCDAFFRPFRGELAPRIREQADRPFRLVNQPGAIGAELAGIGIVAVVTHNNIRLIAAQRVAGRRNEVTSSVEQLVRLGKRIHIDEQAFVLAFLMENELVVDMANGSGANADIVGAQDPQLGREVGNVAVLSGGGAFNLGDVPAAILMRFHDVEANEDALMNKGRFEQGHAAAVFEKLGGLLRCSSKIRLSVDLMMPLGWSAQAISPTS